MRGGRERRTGNYGGGGGDHGCGVSSTRVACSLVERMDGECFPSFTARPETVLYQHSTDCAADVSMRYLPSLRRYAHVRLYGLWLEREPVSRAGLLDAGRVHVIVIVRRTLEPYPTPCTDRGGTLRQGRGSRPISCYSFLSFICGRWKT